jgi:hypothetical protein
MHKSYRDEVLAPDVVFVVGMREFQEHIVTGGDTYCREGFGLDSRVTF